jgi:hypothetical protein
MLHAMDLEQNIKAMLYVIFHSDCNVSYAIRRFGLLREADQETYDFTVEELVAIFRMRYQEHKKMREIAEVFNTNICTIQRRLQFSTSDVKRIYRKYPIMFAEYYRVMNKSTIDEIAVSGCEVYQQISMY